MEQRLQLHTPPASPKQRPAHWQGEQRKGFRNHDGSTGTGAGGSYVSKLLARASRRAAELAPEGTEGFTYGQRGGSMADLTCVVIADWALRELKKELEDLGGWRSRSRQSRWCSAG